MGVVVVVVVGLGMVMVKFCLTLFIIFLAKTIMKKLKFCFLMTIQIFPFPGRTDQNSLIFGMFSIFDVVGCN